MKSSSINYNRLRVNERRNHPHRARVEIQLSPPTSIRVVPGQYGWCRRVSGPLAPRGCGSPEKTGCILQDFFREEPVERAWIFGSFSRMEERLGRKVDLRYLTVGQIYKNLEDFFLERTLPLLRHQDSFLHVLPASFPLA